MKLILLVTTLLATMAAFGANDFGPALSSNEMQIATQELNAILASDPENQSSLTQKLAAIVAQSSSDSLPVAHFIQRARGQILSKLSSVKGQIQVVSGQEASSAGLFLTVNRLDMVLMQDSKPIGRLSVSSSLTSGAKSEIVIAIFTEAKAN